MFLNLLIETNFSLKAANTIAAAFLMFLSILFGLIVVKKRSNIFSKIEQEPSINLTKKLSHSPYIFQNEIVIIIVIGLFINIGGLLLASNLKGILFLDMIGTAVVAMLIGPWWGAVCGLLSNGIVNTILFPELNNYDPFEMIFPFLIVNVIGGIYWGGLGRTDFAKRYFVKTIWKDHCFFIFIFAILGSFLMNLPGSVIPFAIENKGILFYDRDFEQTLYETFWLDNIPYLYNTPWLKLWIALSLYSIPDKIVSILMAVLIIKIALPIYEKLLIINNPFNLKIYSGRLGIVVIAVLYIYPFLSFYLMDIYNFRDYSLLWISPFFIIGTALVLNLSKSSGEAFSDEKDTRSIIYEQIQHVTNRKSKPSFGIAMVLVLTALFSFGVLNNLEGVTLFSFVVFVINLSLLFVAFFFLFISIAQNEIIDDLDDKKLGPIEVTHIFLDIVGFTQDRSIRDQSHIIQKLNDIVLGAMGSVGVDKDDRLFIPTGDGMCITLLGPTRPIDVFMKIALRILSNIEVYNETCESDNRRFEVRLGISENHDNLMRDINGNLNISGPGINTAARLEGLCDPSQILVGVRVYEKLKERESYIGRFKHYSLEVKHGKNITTYQYIDHANKGLNSNTPSSASD